MRQFLALACAVIVSFGLGVLLAVRWVAPNAASGETSTLDHFPVALQREWLPPLGDYDTEGEPLGDEQFDDLLSRLEVAMTAEETLADFGTEAEAHLVGFIRRLALSEVTGDQQERATAYLAKLADRHPGHRFVIENFVWMVESNAPAMSYAPTTSMMVRLFGVEEYDNDGEPFEDAQVDRLLATLDAALTLPEVAADIEREADDILWSFGGRLQMGQISDEQTVKVVAYLDGLKKRIPAIAESVDRERFLAETLTPGRVAPNIVGTDTDGVEFALEDYRGRIVVVIFSGQWCGPCIGEYPYQRAMLDLFDEEDLVLLGVNSDAQLETIRQAKIDEGLAYRTWWDGHGQPDAEYAATEGPIATAWHVIGWPATYVLDEEGVIRYVDKLGGELIATVDRMVTDKQMRRFQEEAEAAAETEEGDGEEPTKPGSEDD